tara:strand:- start:518 stop:898 length:381 start_codon:yes stop_codon:yes gene_type:complete
MAKYVSDGNTFTQSRQVPGALPDNAYDRVGKNQAGKFMKTPHYVYVAKTIPTNDELSFYFKSSASFAIDVGGNGATLLTSASKYTSFGLPTIGTRLDIHPTAFSCSNALSSSINFVYKSGLSTGGR